MYDGNKNVNNSNNNYEMKWIKYKEEGKTATQNCVIRLLRFANSVPVMMNIEHVNAYCHKSK